MLHVLIEHGVDIYSAIEIADNAGRTPVFEAIDNNVSADIIRLLTRKRKDGGFGAKVNVLNYNGQTPLFGAVREGNLESVQVLVEEAGAKVDLTGGEVQKESGDEQEEEQYESNEERFFMEAYKNATTPLHLACILGHDHLMHYLVQKGANPNLQSAVKGYSCLHMAVLANKPEIIIELLTTTNANPHLPDYSGRTLADMVESYIPDYLDSVLARKAFPLTSQLLRTWRPRGAGASPSSQRITTTPTTSARSRAWRIPQSSTSCTRPGRRKLLRTRLYRRSGSWT